MKVNYDEALSNFAFNVNLRRYITVLIDDGSGTAKERCLSGHIKYDVVLTVGAAAEGASLSTDTVDPQKIREILQWAARKSLAGGMISMETETTEDDVSATTEDAAGNPVSDDAAIEAIGAGAGESGGGGGNSTSPESKIDSRLISNRNHVLAVGKEAGAGGEFPQMKETPREVKTEAAVEKAEATAEAGGLLWNKHSTDVQYFSPPPRSLLRTST